MCNGVTAYRGMGVYSPPPWDEVALREGARREGNIRGGGTICIY